MPLSPLPPFAHNVRSLPIALLFFCSLRASHRSLHRHIMLALSLCFFLSLSLFLFSLFLSLRSAFVATVKLVLRGTHLSLISEANPLTMDYAKALPCLVVPWWRRFSTVSKVANISILRYIIFTYKIS